MRRYENEASWLKYKKPDVKMMRKYFIGLLMATVLSSCGLVSKYSNGQHAQFARTLTPEEKSRINQIGEITKDIAFNDPHDIYRLDGTLRVLKTENENVFNFVEVGQWIDHSRLGNSGRDHNLEYRDTITYDNLGNSISRLMYYKEKNGFELGERWTSKIVDGSFIQHIEIFDNTILVEEYDRKIIDFDKPKSDLQKQKQVIGMRKQYSPDGKLKSTTTYDNNGKIVK